MKQLFQCRLCLRVSASEIEAHVHHGACTAPMVSITAEEAFRLFESRRLTRFIVTDAEKLGLVEKTRCNTHNDCDAADAQAAEDHKHIEHCFDVDCDDCSKHGG